MVDVPAIQSAIASIQTAANMVQSLVGIRDSGLIKAKTTELQNAILSAQSSALNAQMDQFTLLNRIRDLEEKVTQMETWKTEKDRYQLMDLGNGQFAYALKTDALPPEPPHKICANCYDARKEKSVLQHEIKFPGRINALVCNNCGAEIFQSGGRGPEHGPKKILPRR